MQLYPFSKPAEGKNEDNHLARLISPDLALGLVADGLSKHYGAIASKNAILGIGLPLERILQNEGTDNFRRVSEELIVHTNDELLIKGKLDDGKKSSTTLDLTLVDLIREVIELQHVGDTSIMLINEDRSITYITPKPDDSSNPNDKPKLYIGMYSHGGDDYEDCNVKNDLTYMQIDLNALKKKARHLLIVSDGITNGLMMSQFEKIVGNYKLGEESPQNLVNALAYAAYSPFEKLSRLINKDKISEDNWIYLLTNYRDQLIANNIDESRLVDIDSFKQVFHEVKDTKLGREMVRTLGVKERYVDDSTIMLIDFYDLWEQYAPRLEQKVISLGGEIKSLRTREVEQETAYALNLGEQTTRDSATIAGLNKNITEANRQLEELVGKNTRLEEETKKLNGMIDESQESNRLAQEAYRTRVINFVDEIYTTTGSRLPENYKGLKSDTLLKLASSKVTELYGEVSQTKSWYSGIWPSKKKKRKAANNQEMLEEIKLELIRLGEQESRYEILRKEIKNIERILKDENRKDLKLRLPEQVVSEDANLVAQQRAISYVQAVVLSYERLNSMAETLQGQVEDLQTRLEQTISNWYSPEVHEATIQEVRDEYKGWVSESNRDAAVASAITTREKEVRDEYDGWVSGSDRDDAIAKAVTAKEDEYDGWVSESDRDEAIANRVGKFDRHVSEESLEAALTAKEDEYKGWVSESDRDEAIAKAVTAKEDEYKGWVSESNRDEAIAKAVT
ncbi:hypothetical protein HOC35_00070, partial [Candidatus Woesearchaeota archaeon]|nr:hypothetical protein [Candidatus Woesearchaeota archaeon]